MYKINVVLCIFLELSLLAACAPSQPDLATQTPEPVLANTPFFTPQASPAATLAQPPQPTQESCSPASLASGSVGADLLDKAMDYLVLLPPCYAEHTTERYPVLYLLHGQNSTQQQWLDLGAGQALERLILDGKTPPFLLVLPFDHSFKQPRDYRFEEVFLDQLIPTIDRDYRTRPERDSRAIGGLSRGGAWAIYLASRHPDLFGVVGAHSLAIFYSNTSALPLRLRDIPDAERPVFYVDAGDKDVDFREIQRFTGLLNSLGFPHEWHYNLGFHDETYWRGHVEAYLLWYGEQFRASP